LFLNVIILISVCFPSDLLCFAGKSKAQKIWEVWRGLKLLFFSVICRTYRNSHTNSG